MWFGWLVLGMLAGAFAVGLAWIVHEDSRAAPECQCPTVGAAQCPLHTPHALWHQAQRETGGGELARERYLQLMREHGHLIARGPGDPPAREFPCGWGDREHPRDSIGRFLP